MLCQWFETFSYSKGKKGKQGDAGLVGEAGDRVGERNIRRLASGYINACFDRAREVIEDCPGNLEEGFVHSIVNLYLIYV